MDRVFEDEFMEAQSRIVALCVEFAGNRADKVYAYGSIEESSISFNAFFNIRRKQYFFQCIFQH